MEIPVPQTLPFGEVLEAVDQHSADEQETLAAILQRRLAEQGRKRAAEEVREARREFAAGARRPVEIDDLMREILP
jgi:hypothetical protein